MSEASLLNDVLFKIVFGDQKNEKILRALLNALLNYKGEQKIASLVIENPSLDKEYVSDKGPILDLKAIDQAGTHYNIEVQLQATKGLESYFKRSVYYWARIFSGQLEQGHQYSKLQKTISISLLDFILFKEIDSLHSTYVLKEKTTDELFLDILEIHYIELKKFSAHKPDSLRTPFEKWLYALKYSKLYSKIGTQLPDSLQDEEGISMAIKTMQKAYARDEVREYIEWREKARRDYEDGIATAREEGREEERANTEKARQQAEEQRRRAEQLATKLKELGVDPDKI